MRKRLFFGGICLLLLIDLTNFTFVVPIIPDFLLKQGVSLSLIGFILSFYQISYFFTSLYFGKRLIVYSKNKVMLAGQIILVISNIALSLLDHNFSVGTVIALSSLLRFIQGIALALVCAAIYAYVPILFPLDLDKKYAVIEISLGSGLALGPVIGGFLYEYVGYFWSFMCMAFVYAGMGLILFPFILRFNLKVSPDPLKEPEEEEHSEQKILSKDDEKNKSGELITGIHSEDLETMTEPISATQILKNRNFVLTFWVFVFSYMCYYIIQPGFSEHIHNYDGSEDTVGMIFGLGDLTYAMTGFILLRFLSKIQIRRKYLFIFGGFMSMISLLILGPEEYTYLPRNLTVVTIGMGVLGFAQMFYTATLIPEFIEIFREIDPNARGTEEMACGLFNASVAATEFLGAILGGVLSDKLGFSRGMSIYAMILLVYLFFFGLLRHHNKAEKKENEEKLIQSENIILKVDSDV